MNPRASAPRMRSGSRGRAQSASLRMVSLKYSGSAISGMRSLKTNLGGKVRNVSDSIPEVDARCAHEVRSTVERKSRRRRRCESSWATLESASRSSSAFFAARRAQPGRDELLDQRCLSSYSRDEVRRWRPSTPNRASRAQALATSASLSPYNRSPASTRATIRPYSSSCLTKSGDTDARSQARLRRSRPHGR